MDNERKENPGRGMDCCVVNVNGQQVFSADWVFTMMQAQSRRIDRARFMALLSLALSVAAIVGLLILAVRCS